MKKANAKRKGKKRSGPRNVTRLPASAAAACDEGPRLIPLRDPVAEPSRFEHYLDLADAALKPGKDHDHASADSEE